MQLWICYSSSAYAEVALTRLFINCQITNATLELSQSINLKFRAVSGQSALCQLLIWARACLSCVWRLPHERCSFSLRCVEGNQCEKGIPMLALMHGLNRLTDRFHSWNFHFALCILRMLKPFIRRNEMNSILNISIFSGVVNGLR